MRNIRGWSYLDRRSTSIAGDAAAKTGRAVLRPSDVDKALTAPSQVQSGGSFDIDYTVYGPNPSDSSKDKIILTGEKERQGDYVFTANEVGEYRFCFDNSVSTFSDKLVDFEIAVRTNAHHFIGWQRS